MLKFIQDSRGELHEGGNGHSAGFLILGREESHRREFHLTMSRFEEQVRLEWGVSYARAHSALGTVRPRSF